MKRMCFLFVVCMLSMLVFAQSDVDTRIAVNDQKDPNTFALIISNENYKYEQAVPFALNDGETFKLYCEKTLGIPEKNIRYVADATLNDMRMQLKWLEKVMTVYEGEARAIVYYSGHGMPSENGQHAYLLPIDGNSALAESGLSTEILYKQLAGVPSQGTIVLLDACFSGARRDGQMLASSRGVAIKAKTEAVTGNMVVFSAAQGEETAYPYKEKQHGLFTYYILKQLQEKGGKVSLGELTDNVIKQVSRTSIIENSKSQTPMVFASTMVQNWQSWDLSHNLAHKYEIVHRNTPTIYSSKDNNSSGTTKENKQERIEETNSIGHVDLTNIVSAKNGQYWIQVYKGGNRRKDRQEAENFATQFAKLNGCPVRCMFISPHWVCRIGKIETYEDALKILKQLEMQGYSNMTIYHKNKEVAF